MFWQKLQNNIVTNGGGDYISAHDPSVYHRSASLAAFFTIISEGYPPCKQTYAVPNKLRKLGELCLAISILMMYNIIYEVKMKQ